MNDEHNEYGAANLNVWQKLRLLQDWYPAVTFAQAFLSAYDPHDKAVVVAEALEWLASKTDATKVDDELVSHLTAVLKSPQGEALLRWAIEKVQKA